MKESIANIIKTAAGMTKIEDRVEHLLKHNSYALRVILSIALNPNVHWDLPKSFIGYTPNELDHDQETILYSEIRRLYLFLKPNFIFSQNNPNVAPEKRVQLFQQLLEMVSREDAELLQAAREKRLHVRGLGESTINAAFPGLLTEGSNG